MIIRSTVLATPHFYSKIQHCCETTFMFCELCLYEFFSGLPNFLGFGLGMSSLMSDSVLGRHFFSLMLILTKKKQEQRGKTLKS